ncbi:MAG: Adaptive-response sensory-kinase SasA [Phycisphaerales bacterium]|nr:Adaptive-response sensory-kinase SasA [Phycisphaerales bacterium]
MNGPDSDPVSKGATARAQISLRLRLTLWIAAISMVIHLTLSVLVLVYQKLSVQNYFDSRFDARIIRIISALNASEFEVGSQQWQNIASENLWTPNNDPYLATLYQVRSVVDADPIVSTAGSPIDGRTVLQWLGRDRREAVRRDRVPVLETAQDPAARFRTFLRRLDGPGGHQFVLAVSATDTPAMVAVQQLSSVLLMAIPGGVLAAGVAGYVISGIVLRPIRELRHLTGAMYPEHLDRTVNVQVGVPELAALQHELEDSRRRLRASLVAHDRFISNVSHELKTPVAVLLTEAQTIDRTGMSPDQARFVESVAEEMRRVGRMIESFLTLTRVRAGKALAHTERCDLNEVIMQSVETCMAMARQHSVEIEPTLLEDTEDTTVYGDAELLRIMIDNLVRNAIRFSPKGGTVEIGLHGEVDRWVIVVRDLGPGIPSEIMGNLFDRFTQGGSETIRGRGSGLGLSIAQGIAELHAGVINVQNLQPGCQFEISIPKMVPLTTSVNSTTAVK